ncbi:hypothetical protein AMJ80_08530 [bacterium SM23_31]|nr:MAG: hypothetical protein AMJ80_08530 [bacterium SM23_31]
MKKITILLSLIIFTGLTIIIPLFGMENTSCYAQEAEFEQKKSLLDKNSIKTLIPMIKDTSLDKGDPTSTLRSQAILNITRVNVSEEIVDTLVVTLIYLLEHDINDRVRSRAATTLGFLGDKKAVPFLNKALEHPFVELRMEAAYALVKLGLEKDEKVFSTLKDIVLGKDIETWDIDALISKEYYNEFAKRTKDGLRVLAILRIVKIKEPKTKALLELMTKDPDDNLRAWAEKLLKEHFIK